MSDLEKWGRLLELAAQKLTVKIVNSVGLEKSIYVEMSKALFNVLHMLVVSAPICRFQPIGLFQYQKTFLWRKLLLYSALVLLRIM
jgi:hypothetical protein